MQVLYHMYRHFAMLRSIFLPSNPKVSKVFFGIGFAIDICPKSLLPKDLRHRGRAFRVVSRLIPRVYVDLFAAYPIPLGETPIPANRIVG